MFNKITSHPKRYHQKYNMTNLTTQKTSSNYEQLKDPQTWIISANISTFFIAVSQNSGMPFTSSNSRQMNKHWKQQTNKTKAKQNITKREIFVTSQWLALLVTIKKLIMQWGHTIMLHHYGYINGMMTGSIEHQSFFKYH